MLLPTVSGQSAAGCKWKNCCRRSWEMLMAPVSPKNLRTTALLTSIYQLVSSNIHVYIVADYIRDWRMDISGGAQRTGTQGDPGIPEQSTMCSRGPKYKNYALDMQSHTPLGAQGGVEGGNGTLAPAYPRRSPGAERRRRSCGAMRPHLSFVIGNVPGRAPFLKLFS